MTIQLRTTRRALPPRLVVYGPPKVGKTTFAAGAPGCVFLPTEDGLGNLDVPVIAGESGKILSWGELLYAVDIAGQVECKTVVIDSITACQDLCFAEVAKREGVESIADIDYGKGYSRALPLWLGLLARLDMLRQAGRAIILIGHSQVEAYSDPEGEPYDRHALRLYQQKDGKPSLRASTMEWADVLAFASQRVYRSNIGKGFDKRTVAGGGERVLYMQPSPARAAGSRYSLPAELPLTWDAFFGAYRVAAAKPAAPEPSAEPITAPAEASAPEEMHYDRPDQPSPDIDDEPPF